MSIRQQAIGTWSLAAVTIDGPTKVEPYGPNPRGLMVMDAGGHFTVAIVRAGVAKFASNNRVTGTDAENRAAVQASLAYFGRYTIDDSAGTVTVTIKGSTFPNFEGQSQTRTLACNGDELIVTNAAPSGGGGVARQVWQRLR